VPHSESLIMIARMGRPDGRNERRALSRRKAAIRNFDAARTLAISRSAHTKLNVTYET
jgi:hypothetical protein